MTGTVTGCVRRTAAAALLVLVAPACEAGQGADGAGGGAEAADTPRAAASQESARAGRGADQAAPETTIDVAGVTVTVEVADEPDERRRGLMHRDSLPEDHGMLFVYSREQTLSFWMRDTRMPLDIAFLDSRGYIVDLQQMEPQSDRMHESRRPAMYALEMRRGWFADHGIEEGDRVRF